MEEEAPQHAAGPPARDAKGGPLGQGGANQLLFPQASRADPRPHLLGC